MNGKPGAASTSGVRLNFKTAVPLHDKSYQIVPLFNEKTVFKTKLCQLKSLIGWFSVVCKKVVQANMQKVVQRYK